MGAAIFLALAGIHLREARMSVCTFDQGLRSACRRHVSGTGSVAGCAAGDWDRRWVDGFETRELF